jgi:hypothetical protein
VRDELLDQGAQAAEDTSAVEKVRVALLERDEALRKAREDLAAVWAVVTELASARAQLQQDRATLEGGGPGRARPRRKPRRLSS